MANAKVLYRVSDGMILGGAFGEVREPGDGEAVLEWSYIPDPDRFKVEGGVVVAYSQAELDDNVYRVARYWASVAARYVDCFEPDAEKATAAMRLKTLPDGDARISYDVTDPVDDSRVTFQVFLTQEPDAAGTQKYWRAYRLGYAPLGNDDAVVTPQPANRAVPQPSTPKPTTQES